MKPTEIRKKAKNIDFRKTVDRPLPPFHTDLKLLPVINPGIYSRVIQSPFCYLNEICISGAFYDDFRILDEEENIINAKHQTDGMYLIRRAGAAETEGNLLIDFCQTANKYQNSPSADQLHFIQNYITKTTAFLPWFTYIIAVGNWLEKIIEGKIFDQIGDKTLTKTYTTQITTPDRPSLHNLEETALSAIAAARAKGETTDELIDRHLQTYAYIGFRDGVGAFWTKTDIEDRIRQLLAKDPPQTGQPGIDQIIKILRPDDHFLRLIDIARKYVWLRTFRSDIYSHAFALVAPVMKTYVSRLGYTEKDYLLFSVNDYLLGLHPDREELSKRQVAFASIGIGGKYLTLSGKPALAFKQFLDDKVKLGTNIAGTVASKTTAKITGVAKIVITPDDFSKVKPNDIIVSTMTTPNFVPVMNIAAGFVTDEGGILCHAAIISREMAKPCIVGTANGTRIIKDNDRIEMDLEKGVVTVLKS